MATTKNIAITINNGTDYDTLYPTANLANYTGTLPLTATSGTLAVSRGGTGGTTGAAGLYNLVNPCGALTNTGVATGDYFPMLDTSATTGKKITLANLTTYLSGQISGSVKIASGSYTGTGVTTTSAYVAQLSMNFTPFFFVLSTDVSLTETPITGYSNDYATRNSYLMLALSPDVAPFQSSSQLGITVRTFSKNGTTNYVTASLRVFFKTTGIDIYYLSNYATAGSYTSLVADAIFNDSSFDYFWFAMGI